MRRSDAYLGLVKSRKAGQNFGNRYRGEKQRARDDEMEAQRVRAPIARKTSLQKALRPKP
jgi:hypothetical protein